MSISKLLVRKPRFVPELGAWEGWLTPLKWFNQTNLLSITYHNKRYYLEWLKGDELMIYWMEKQKWKKRLFDYTRDYEFFHKAIVEGEVKFVTKSSRKKMLKQAELDESFEFKIAIDDDKPIGGDSTAVIDVEVRMAEEVIA